MNKYVKELVDYFQKHADPEKAEPMEAYMRNRYEFLGIKTPERKEILRDFVKNNGQPGLVELEEVTLSLWNQPEREFQNVALAFLDKQIKQLTPAHLPLLEILITTKSWWDTVDHLATRLVGSLFYRHPKIAEETTKKWIHSDNMWLNRTAILYQLKYKNETDEAKLFNYIRLHSQSKEFFIQKAIGWALREYSKTNREAVFEFVEKEPLQPLSKREALKYWKERN